MEEPVHVGQIVADKYAVERILARGGGGVVVRAKHLQLLEPCAIKFMLPEALLTPMARERFLREARACARLKSDHVIKVFDVGELDDQTPYMVLEYLEGMDLDDHMELHGALPVSEAVLYVLQMCAALAEAHALGIVHRDLKPANVFLTRLPDGTTRLKVLDFGISKILREPAGPDQEQTVAGVLMGSPPFMAPEQVRGAAIDTRADIWAVGVILYFLVTGELPFCTDAMVKTLAMILLQAPRPPSDHVPDIPPALERIILQCLEKELEDRPANVSEIAAAIAPFAGEEGAPLSLHVRRIFESAPDGRDAMVSPMAREVSLARPPPAAEPAPPAHATPQAVEPVETQARAEPVRPSWKVPVAIAAVGGLAVFVIAVAMAAGGPAPLPVADAETARPAVAAPTARATTIALDPPPPRHDVVAVTARASGHAPSAASAAPSHPTSFSSSPGFDLGSRH